MRPNQTPQTKRQRFQQVDLAIDLAATVAATVAVLVTVCHQSQQCPSVS